MSRAPRPDTGEQSEQRCIVWHPRSRPADAELLGALQRRSLPVKCVSDPFRAMAELCRARNDNGALVLLLCDPNLLERVGEVAACVRRYAPRAVVWVFDASRRLRAATGRDLGSGQPGQSPVVVPERTEPKVRTARPVPSAQPRLRLAGEGPLPAEDSPDLPALSAGGSGAPASRPVLTDEELQMLLAPRTINGNG
jgi:hypothetical protein